MEVAFSDTFKKAFKKRVLSTTFEAIFWDKLNIFINDPYDSSLKTHKLTGKLKDLWSFSIAYDIRVVFYFTKDKPKKSVFIDIGSHDNVY
jgi:mRNA-degrading endonuclease YafQ of YafQ-DinJ toxin-antitoxin module